MKQNRLMLEAAINTPNGNEYSKDEHIAISRRTKYISHDGVVLTRRNYSVSGMTDGGTRARAAVATPTIYSSFLLVISCSL